MDPILRQAQDRLGAFLKEREALKAKATSDTLDDTERLRVETLTSDIKKAREEVEAAKSLSGLADDSDAFLNGVRSNLPSIAAMTEIPKGEERFAAIKGMRTKARFLSTIFPDKREAQAVAYRLGMFALAAMGGERARKYCKDHGIAITKFQGDIQAASHTEGINEDGGFLVPEEFEHAMVDLREQFGIFRSYARNSPMAGDTKSRPRRAQGLTAYFVGETEAAAESKMGWDRVNLTAKKLMVLTKFSSELGEDSIIDLGDTLAGEMAYAFAKKEDQCGFIGTGTSTYGGIVGITQRLLDVYTTSGGVGLILGAGNLFSELTLANFNSVAGALPEYAETNNVAWYCHKVFFETVMVRLMMAAGGVTMAEIATGARRQFMGYPVRVSQIMPKTDANGQVPVIFGDLGLSSDFGDRRSTTVAFSVHSEFDTDEIGARGTERFDISNHSVGDSTDPGPVVGLVMASS
jgi:HK97 family phage major capsid protein